MILPHESVSGCLDFISWNCCGSLMPFAWNKLSIYRPIFVLCSHAVVAIANLSRWILSLWNFVMEMAFMNSINVYKAVHMFMSFVLDPSTSYLNDRATRPDGSATGSDKYLIHNKLLSGELIYSLWTRFHSRLFKRAQTSCLIMREYAE